MGYTTAGIEWHIACPQCHQFNNRVFITMWKNPFRIRRYRECKTPDCAGMKFSTDEYVIAKEEFISESIDVATEKKLRTPRRGFAFPCPHCMSFETRIFKIFQKPTGFETIKRVRFCMNCGRKFKTIEKEHHGTEGRTPKSRRESRARETTASPPAVQ